MNSLPLVESPAWLLALTRESLQQVPFPLTDILQGSVYYPASGTDGHVVEFLGRNAASFVHVDYSRPQEEVRAQLVLGFAGYTMVGMRSVTQRELTPTGWRPTLFNPRGHRPMPASANPANAFALWAVYERDTTRDASHGPQRFSLLHLHAEGVAAYDALYRGNGLQAYALAIVQPGEGYGDNWTYFTKPEEPLHTVVMGHAQGPPAYLVRGGGGSMEHYKEKSCWPEYSQLVAEKSFYSYPSGDAYLTLWSHK
jgi:hypothetical protein